MWHNSANGSGIPYSQFVVLRSSSVDCFVGEDGHRLLTIWPFQVFGASVIESWSSALKDIDDGLVDFWVFNRS